MRAPGFYLDIFVGALIVVAVIFNQVAARQRSAMTAPMYEVRDVSKRFGNVRRSTAWTSTWALEKWLDFSATMAPASRP